MPSYVLTLCVRMYAPGRRGHMEITSLVRLMHQPKPKSGNRAKEIIGKHFSVFRSSKGIESGNPPLQSQAAWGYYPSRILTLP